VHRNHLSQSNLPSAKESPASIVHLVNPKEIKQNQIQQTVFFPFLSEFSILA
jgi:hypothetical protein